MQAGDPLHGVPPSDEVILGVGDATAGAEMHFGAGCVSNRRPVHAGQPGSGRRADNSTGDRSGSTIPNACWTASWIMQSPMSSQCGDTAAA